MKKTLGLIVIVLIGAALGFLAGNREVPEAESEITFGNSETATLSASQLAADFSMNPAAAESRYAGRPLAVEGLVGGHGKDGRGNFFIMLASDDGTPIVKCWLVPGTAIDTTALRAGGTTSVFGFCEGKTDVVELGYCTVRQEDSTE